MPILDRYLETLRSPGAEYLTFRPSAPVELCIGGVSRTVSKGVATSDQILRILGEVLPAEVMQEAANSPRDFRYESPIGPICISVGAQGRGELSARVARWAESGGARGRAPQGAASGPRPSSEAPAPSSATLAPASAAPSRPSPVSASPPSAPTPAATATARLPPRAVPARPEHLDDLFHQMLDLEASDLHLKSDRPPYCRVHGAMDVLAGRASLSGDELTALIQAIMPEARRREFEEKRDTDFAYELKGRARLRCNVFKDLAGIGAVFRQIPGRIRSASELGLSETILRFCSHRKGLVLVTGPTGSGKSTTLAALIDHINATRREHIITIEDPVEFVHQDKLCLVNQREIGASTLSFKAALRAALREDPDVVLVGELRDLETTAIAIETAETGHLVFATLHTNSAMATVDRVINQFPADRQAQIRAMLAESLLGVVSQVLCKKKGGGRIAAHEVLVVTSAVSNLIREEKVFQLPSVMQTGRGLGMQTMNDSLLAHVRSGALEPAEAYGSSPSKAEMALALTRGGFRGAWSQEEA